MANPDVLKGQIEIIQGYYNKIYLDKLTVEEILNMLEKDREYLQQEFNLQFFDQSSIKPVKSNDVGDVENISKSELIEFITALGENCGNDKKMEWYHGLLSDIEIAFTSRIVNDNSLTIGDYKEVIEDNKRLVKELDFLINGKNSAKQASLCDIVYQLKASKLK